MSNSVTILSVIINPVNDYLKSISILKDKRQFWNVFLFFTLGFTGIPMIRFGQIKKGFIILGSLIAGAGSIFLFDLLIVRQIFCLIWFINYIKSFWELLDETDKKWIFKITMIMLCFVPIEFVVLYLFQVAK